jgi:hypothetical protein
MTLDGNSEYNMSLIGMCYNFKNVICAAFKGDDSFIVAEKITDNMDGVMTVANTCKYKIKAHRVKIAEYIANIILPNGSFFPDVIRRTSRVLSKIYTVDLDWQEAKASLMDCLDVVSDDEALHYGCEVAALYYAQFGMIINADEIRYLLNFLLTLTRLENLDHVPTKVWRIINV